jgi:putative ABC transport system permease protein
MAGPGYLATMGMSLQAGRDFSERDRLGGPRVAIVNQAFARQFWPGQDAVGKWIRHDDQGPRQIVGVIKDVKQREWAVAARPELYRPYLQERKPRELALVVRTAGEASPLAAAIQREASAVDGTLPVARVLRMDRVVAGAMGEPRFNLLLLNLFAGLALILAAVGLYSVLAQAVSRRTQEIGIRMALGARAAEVFRLVVGQGMVLTAAGVTIGLVAALATTRLMSALLFEVSATDPATFVLIPAVLIAVAFVACWLPARRATRIDPVIALRTE